MQENAQSIDRSPGHVSPGARFDRATRCSGTWHSHVEATIPSELAGPFSVRGRARFVLLEAAERGPRRASIDPRSRSSGIVDNLQRTLCLPVAPLNLQLRV